MVSCSPRCLGLHTVLGLELASCVSHTPITRYLAVHELSKHAVYSTFDMGELGKILADADFHAISENRVSSTTVGGNHLGKL